MVSLVHYVTGVNNPEYISAAIQTWPPGDDIELGWNIMMRTMQGQGPKIQSILVPPQKITILMLRR